MHFVGGEGSLLEANFQLHLPSQYKHISPLLSLSRVE